MINAKNIGIAVLAVGALLGLLAFVGFHWGGGASFGTVNNGAAVINYPEWFTNGTGGTSNVFYAGNTQQFSIADNGNLTSGTITAGATTLSGNLTITTTNAATSTATVGCVQTYATSTATPVYFALVVSKTASTTFAGTGQGNVMWAFGSCPK